ncbi:hypothetical protein JOB18_000539 [Solea senegalensis]|uniref:tRNA methyltransferase 10 homolog C n=2 Tax=Solea senegalensis TaxID=28829 RepID=A0AAV6PZK7_SOLSE|nr:tRNA methyltransferase 10 homolog C [Solea senegalensis]KAG7481620.1 hypothetical protein JOB18_000539 [Solea senegalensis]
MFRLFTQRSLHELYRCRQFVSSRVTKKQLVTFHRTVCRHRTFTPVLARPFSSGSPLRTDVLQPKGDKSAEEESVDLDKWKSVMRSKAVPEETQQVNIDEEASDDDDGDLTEPEGDLKGRSLLEATRDLVVMWQQAGKLVPHEMSDEELVELSKLTTKSSRKKFLKYLALKEGIKRARKEKQQRKKAEREAILEQKKQEGGNVELKNTFLLQYWNRSLDKLLAWRSAQAMLFNQPLVFDMSYDSSMSKRELENTVAQLMEVEAWNRRATEPFHLHFCNLETGGAYEKELVKRYSAETWDKLFITSTDRQHVDVFPRERLVYLTADSPNILHNFDHSKVYIIGSLVDRSIQSGLSLANAKRLKLATARLPLDQFLHWEIGAKNLTLDQMIRILLTVKETGKWEEALKFVPKRKHDGFLEKRNQRDVFVQNRVRGVANNRPAKDSDRLLKTGQRNAERTFKNVDQSLYRLHNEPRSHSRDSTAGLFSDRDRKPAGTTVRVSLKSKMVAKKQAGKGKMWWGDE